MWLSGLYRVVRSNAQELLGIPAALALFWLSGIVLRWVEPNSAIYDAGVLQGATVVIVNLLIGNSIARVGVRINKAWFYGSRTISNYDKQWLYVIYFAGYCLLSLAA